MHSVMNGPVISTKDAATILGRHVSTIKRYVDAGRLLPAHTITADGKVVAYTFHRSDVEALAAELDGAA